MLKWFISPTGEKVTIEDALNGALHEYYPMPYLVACADERPWTGKPSTTQLINGTRMEYLKIITPYAIDPKDQAFRILGTRAHTKLEELAPFENITELEMESDEITGICDLLERNPDGTWRLTDYKTWGSFRVMLALGLEKKRRLAFNQYGDPILYQKSGKWGKAGTQKYEDYYEPNPEFINNREAELQLNRYRVILEKYNYTISEMMIFYTVRDGGCWDARNRGIYDNVYFKSIEKYNDDYIYDYFSRKKVKLLSHLDQYRIEMNSQIIGDIIIGKEHDVDFEILKRRCPPECSEEEVWYRNGRPARCLKYCPVSEMCKKIGCRYL